MFQMRFIYLISGLPISITAFFLIWPLSGEPIVGGDAGGVIIGVVFLLGLPCNLIIGVFVYLLLFVISDLTKGKAYFSNLYEFINDPNMYLVYFPLVILLIAIHINSTVLFNLLIMLKDRINRDSDD